MVTLENGDTSWAESYTVQQSWMSCEAYVFARDIAYVWNAPYPFLDKNRASQSYLDETARNYMTAIE